MSCNVFANGDAIACKAGDDMVIAAFPDVCLSPPSPPAGPIPVPYPNTSKSKDMQRGSKTVMIKNKEVMLKDQSFYQTSPLGDEAATKGLGAGVVTHVITGKTYFVMWSMDVQFEGQNVDRHTDLTTSNHASPVGNESLPKDAKEDSAEGEIKITECPCCKAPLHDNQKDPATGEAYKPIKEADFNKKGLAYYQKKMAGLPAFLTANPGFAATPAGAAAIANGNKQLADAEKAVKTLEEARAKKPPCPNLHDPADEGCGTHFDKTNPDPKTSDEKVRKKLGFTKEVREESIALHPTKPDGTPVPKSASVSHKTPLSAGGCPSSQSNLVPKESLSAECQEVDDAQTTLQGGVAESLKKGK